MNRLLAVIPVLALSFGLSAGDGMARRPLGEPGCGGWVTSLIVGPHDSPRMLVGSETQWRTPE